MRVSGHTALTWIALGVFAGAAHCTTSTGPQCGNSVSDDGPSSESSAVVVNANLVQGECPQIIGITASPYDVTVGGSSRVAATVTPLEAGIPTMLWSAASGSFADPAAAATTFTCAAPGIVQLNFSATAEGSCQNTSSVPVDCHAKTP